MRMKKIFVVVLNLLMGFTSFSQKELAIPAIPSMRVLHHESIIASLNTIAKLNRKTDHALPITRSDTLNQAINRSVRVLVNNMRAGIEVNTALDNNAKFKWLRGVNEMLTSFISLYRAGTIGATLLPSLVKAYDDAMRLDMNGQSIAPIVADNASETGNILIDNYALKENKGIPTAKDIIVLKACQRDPDKILQILTKYPSNSYADSLIILAAFRDQEELYNYASVPNALGRRIQSVNHPLVKIISRMALMKTGRMYFLSWMIFTVIRLNSIP